uniref:HIRAN domain-containing protein n=1 Tax=Chenopodium quinoa TaxID=63459 RepID=A0A803MI34_CHEQI
MNSNKKRINFRGDVNFSSKKKKISAVWIDLIQLGHKIDDSISGGFESLSSMLEPDKPYTIGRSNRVAHFIFNDSRINEGVAVELCVGDEVMLVCGNTIGVCGGLNSWIGFMVRSIVFQEELVTPGFNEFRVERPRLSRPLLPGKVNKRVFATLRVRDLKSLSFECDEVVRRAKTLSACCNQIVHSDDPVSYIRRCIDSCYSVGGSFDCVIEGNRFKGIEPNNNIKTMTRSVSNVVVGKQHPVETLVVKDIRGLRDTMKQSTLDTTVLSENLVSSVLKAHTSYPNMCTGNTDNSSEPICINGRNSPLCEAMRKTECHEKIPSPPGKNFYLNDLNCVHQGSSRQNKVVSLPEILHPVDSILRMFIATFTSDIEWFLSYCDIPSHLPVTVACHNTEKCWSGDPSERSCAPYPNFPNLVVVYPPFPEVIAFGKDRKNRGVGCHHPKLLVLQREDSMRVIITSANLVAKQWQSVTNTIWWQDFPHKKSPECTSLFNRLNRSTDNDLSSDFSAQLAGFMATLVNDVPSEAHWIVELTKYDFSGANGYLVASVPGIHSYKSLSAASPYCKFKCSEMLLGSVEASVVGLSHLFRTAVDTNGIQLRKLASYLDNSTVCGVSEILLRREKNVPADPNAVSVVVPNSTELSKGDCVQLGFLPRAVAKWVSPLWDSGFFRFCGHLCSREALAAAFGENSLKVQLILHGPNFLDLPKTVNPEHAVAFCSLVASLQRCTGLRRLEEVLHRYKWPEPLESDFIYGSSSIGTSVSAQFLAAFSAAAGKRSQNLYDSEESDPEWGRWNTTHELKNPSIRVIFPTIDRVKSAHCGILPSKHLLSFSEKTWQRLKTVNILHDAIPQPGERVGYPMHVKVARRRFKSKKDGSSFGWIYCGSHNMSAAAWGRPISSPSSNLVSGRSEEQSSVSSLHVCNYELGIIFVFPPPKIKVTSQDNAPNLDDICLPFVEPAPRYGPRDRPATKRAMSEALTELAKEGRAIDLTAVEDVVEEVPNEDDEVATVNCLVPEVEEDIAYAEFLWHQLDSSQSC